MAMAVTLLVQGMNFIAQPVHRTLFPYPIAATFHAARISLAYQANARAAAASTGAQLAWGTYIVGYLIMAWGGTLWTHHILHIPPPMLYSPAPYIIYTTTHLALTLLTALAPRILAPASQALIDTALFPLDALVRTAAITSATSLLSLPQTHTLPPTPLTHLIIGALASSGGALTASTFSTWSAAWSLSTPPVLRASVLASMDVWAGALAAGVCGTLSARVRAFEGVRAGLAGWAWPSGWAMDDAEARAVAAGLLVVCFGARVYLVHWAGKVGKGTDERKRKGKSE